MYCIKALSLIFGLTLFRSSYQANCYSCASTVLLNQWEATAFPYKPTSSDMQFVDTCLNPPNAAIKNVPCSGPCVEATYVINGIYAIVRGCYTTLMQGTSQSINIGNNNITCSYYTIPSISAVIDNNGNEQTGGVAVAVKFCNSVTCNNALTSSAADPTSYETGNLLSYCTPGTQISCYSCSHFLTGKCTKDPSSTCTGAWCTKVEGKINGQKIVTRGCAPINPLTISDQFCVPRNSATTISQIGSNLTLSYDATQCFCNKDRCNSVGKTVLSIGTILMSIILFVQ